MRFSFFKPGEFHDAVFDEPLYLVAPIIPAGGIVMLHGPPTAGKTQLAITLGVSVLQGGLFLGEYQAIKGTVLLFEADMSRRLLQERLKSCPETRDFMVFHTDPINIVALAQEMANGVELPDPILEAAILRPTLVIVDTLRSTNTLDESDPVTAAKVYAAWKMIFPGSTFLFLHHDRKKPRDPNAYLRPEEAASGSSAWLGNADTGLRMDRDHLTRGGEHVATLSFSKCRTCEAPEPMQVRMLDDSLLLEPTLPNARRVMARWIHDNPDGEVSDAVRFLVKEGLCNKARGYKLWKELTVK